MPRYIVRAVIGHTETREIGTDWLDHAMSLLRTLLEQGVPFVSVTRESSGIAAGIQGAIDWVAER